MSTIFLSSSERKMISQQILLSYFLERPLSLSVIPLLDESKEGMTATELAKKLHLSVPALYRLISEMHQFRMLEVDIKDRKFVYKVAPSLRDTFPSVYDNAKKVIENTTSKVDQLMITNSMSQDHNLSLGPLVYDDVIISVLKQKIHEYLPQGIQEREMSILKTVLNEKAKFNLCLGNDNEYVIIDLKIIWNISSLLERIGTIAMLNTQVSNHSPHPVGMILAYMITTLNNNWAIDEQTVSQAISSLNIRNIKLLPTVLKTNRMEMVDSNFIDQFSIKVIEKVNEALSVN